MRTIGFASLATAVLLASACTDDGPPVDPTGSWSLHVQWPAAATCGLTGSTPWNFSVQHNGDGYVMVDGTAAITGTADCTAADCTVYISETNTVSGVTARVTATLTVDGAGGVVGSGNVSRNSDGCVEVFAASGSKI